MISEFDFEERKLSRFGFDLSKIENYQVLCLPENFLTADTFGELHEAGETRHLAKLIKASGVTCATSYEFGLELPLLQRRSNDKWLGAVWIRDYVAAPLVVAVIGSVITADFQHPTPDRVNPKVHLELYLQNGPNITKLSYKGDPATLQAVLQSLNPADKK